MSGISEHVPSPSKSVAVNADCADGTADTEVGEFETTAVSTTEVSAATGSVAAGAALVAAVESGGAAEEASDEADDEDEDDGDVLEHAAAVSPSAAIPLRRRNDLRSAVTPRAGSGVGAFMANIQHRIRKHQPGAP